MVCCLQARPEPIQGNPSQQSAPQSPGRYPAAAEQQPPQKPEPIKQMPPELGMFLAALPAPRVSHHDQVSPTMLKQDGINCRACTGHPVDFNAFRKLCVFFDTPAPLQQRDWSSHWQVAGVCKVVTPAWGLCQAPVIERCRRCRMSCSHMLLWTL